LLRTGANLGFAGGNNAGIRRAMERGADWVLLLNNDAIVEPGLSDALARAADARPDAGILACKILFEKGRKLQYAGARFNPRLGYSGRLTGYGKEDKGDESLRDVGRADGAAFALSRVAYNEVGGLDESLYMYVEDVDLSFRVRRAGFGVVFVPDARVRHKGSAASGGRASTANLFYSVRNTIAVSERYAPMPRGLRALRRFVVVAAHLAQAMSHPDRVAAMHAVIAGWRAARAGRSGRR
jgi:GT2 family glycosyltransferase